MLDDRSMFRSRFSIRDEMTQGDAPGTDRPEKG
jgi:hypothetical protein